MAFLKPRHLSLIIYRHIEKSSPVPSQDPKDPFRTLRQSKHLQAAGLFLVSVHHGGEGILSGSILTETPRGLLS